MERAIDGQSKTTAVALQFWSLLGRFAMIFTYALLAFTLHRWQEDGSDYRPAATDRRMLAIPWVASAAISLVACVVGVQDGDGEMGVQILRLAVTVPLVPVLFWLLAKLSRGKELPRDLLMASPRQADGLECTDSKPDATGWR